MPPHTKREASISLVKTPISLIPFMHMFHAYVLCVYVRMSITNMWVCVFAQLRFNTPAPPCFFALGTQQAAARPNCLSSASTFSLTHRNNSRTQAPAWRRYSFSILIRQSGIWEVPLRWASRNRMSRYVRFCLFVLLCCCYFTPTFTNVKLLTNTISTHLFCTHAQTRHMIRFRLAWIQLHAQNSFTFHIHPDIRFSLTWTISSQYPSLMEICYFTHMHIYSLSSLLLNNK